MNTEDDFNEWAEVAPGRWAPAIPLPLMGVRKRCYCGRRFWSMPGYRGHYALAHILERDANFPRSPPNGDDMTTQPTPEQILAVEMPQPNDAGAHTIRDYLVMLLATLWKEQEGFSSKCPLGNSGWEFDLYLPLVRTGHIQGSVDEDGYLDECDSDAGFLLIADAIATLRLVTDVPA